MISTLLLNVAGAAMLVGVWVTVAVHVYRSFSPDGRQQRQEANPARPGAASRATPREAGAGPSAPDLAGMTPYRLLPAADQIRQRVIRQSTDSRNAHGMATDTQATNDPGTNGQGAGTQHPAVRDTARRGTAGLGTARRGTARRGTAGLGTARRVTARLGAGSVTAVRLGAIRATRGATSRLRRRRTARPVHM